MRKSYLIVTIFLFIIISLSGYSQCHYTIDMQDSYGDGWNGNVLSIMSEDSVASMAYTIETGAYGTAQACIDMSGCNTISVGGGLYGAEVSWSISDADGAILSEGGSPDTLFVGTCYIDGCTDETALNFDIDATVDDGTCIAIVEGCMNADYAEYNADVNVEDGSCTTLLCASTVVSMDMVDSYGDGWNGNILSLNGEEYTLAAGSEGSSVVGECGGYGCMNPDAANYDVDATDDDGSCVFECPLNASGEVYNVTVDTAGLTIINCYYYIWESQYDYTIEEIEGYGYDCSCVEAPIPGCMDMEANNYDPLATVDDSSCIPFMFGCINIMANNYDVDANIDDGSCVWFDCEGELSYTSLNILVEDSVCHNNLYCEDYNWDGGDCVYDCNNNLLTIWDIDTYFYNGQCDQILNCMVYNFDNQSCIVSPNSECGSIQITVNNGWNMIGFSCNENTDAIEAFSSIQDKIVIAKDASGNTYLASFNFNGIGDLERGMDTY